MTSLPQPYGDDQGDQLDARIVAAEAELVHRAEQKQEARRALRRLRRARRAAAVTRTSSPASLAGLGVVTFITAIVMFIKGSAQAADMLSAAVGFWALALAVRRTK